MPISRFCLIILCIVLQSCSNDVELKTFDENAIILAFGDSLTYGTGAKRSRSYPAYLQKIIKREVINAGIPGELSKTGLKRLPSLLKKHQPALVILCHGANDILHKKDLNKAKDNLQKMITQIKESGSQVLLLSVPSFGLFLSPAPFYDQLASENNIPVLNDMLSEILLQPKLKTDYVHPNAKGYRTMAQKIAEFLKN